MACFLMSSKVTINLLNTVTKVSGILIQSYIIYKK